MPRSKHAVPTPAMDSEPPSTCTARTTKGMRAAMALRIGHRGLGAGAAGELERIPAGHEVRAVDGFDPPRDKQAYQLPHHEVIDGRLDVVWNGVVAAMAVVNGARGGVDLPERDRRPVYEHLASHYREFGEEPPELEV